MGLLNVPSPISKIRQISFHCMKGVKMNHPLTTISSFPVPFQPFGSLLLSRKMTPNTCSYSTDIGIKKNEEGEPPCKFMPFTRSWRLRLKFVKFISWRYVLIRLEMYFIGFIMQFFATSFACCYSLLLKLTLSGRKFGKLWQFLTATNMGEIVKNWRFSLWMTRIG